jgi:hypothetical protein
MASAPNCERWRNIRSSKYSRANKLSTLTFPKPHTMLAIPRSDCGEDWPPGNFRRGSASTLGMSASEQNNILRALQDPQKSPALAFTDIIPLTLEQALRSFYAWRLKHETYHLLYYISSISIKPTFSQQHFPIPLTLQALDSAELDAVDVQARRSPPAAIANPSSATRRKSFRGRRPAFHFSRNCQHPNTTTQPRCRLPTERLAHPESPPKTHELHPHNRARR